MSKEKIELENVAMGCFMALVVSEGSTAHAPKLAATAFEYAREFIRTKGVQPEFYKTETNTEEHY